MNDELISIVMTVYNGEEFIEESIESILGQTYKNFEFIIIDDGSTDNTESIVKGYKDPRIKYFKQTKCGVTISLNKGIGVAKGMLIARQDADDISLPDRLEKQYKFMKANPDVHLLGTYAYIINDKNEFIKEVSFPTSNDEIKKIIETSNPFIHGSIMMRRECLKEVGLYREQFFMCQSYDLWLRIIEKYQAAIYPQLLYKYRIWDSSNTGQSMATNNCLKAIIKEFCNVRKLFGKDSITFNNYEFYTKYSSKILEAYNKKEIHCLLKDESL